MTVRVELTNAEANALWRAAGNSMDAWQDAIALLLHPSSVLAGYRALEKLRAALIAAER